MNKVVSIALFGKDADNYAQYLSTFVLAHANLFPREEGWRLYLATDGRTSPNAAKLISSLSERRLLDFCVYPSAPLCKAMLWRMDTVFHAAQGGENEPWQADFVFCRDLDAIPMPRDRACCDEFIRVSQERKLAMHTIHDSEYHIGIMGGLCGFNAKLLREVTGWRSLQDLYDAVGYTDEQWAHKGADQLALNKLLLRAGGPRLFEHRFNGWHGGPGVKPARAAGQYLCAGVSSPVPNDGSHFPLLYCKTDLPDIDALTRQADRLGKHLGCAGYDLEAARKFWFTFGDPKIAEKIRACEANQ